MRSHISSSPESHDPQPIPYYWKSVDWDALMSDYPPPPHYARTTGQMSGDELRALQNSRFRARMAEAWKIPFYRERWKGAGLEPSDVRSLDDVAKIPPFTSDDLKNAIAAAPPFGSHHPFGREGLARMPVKIQTSGGTTGLPRITLFDPIAIEVQAIQTARALYAQGARPGDIIQITYTNALPNAGWCAHDGIHRWLGATPLTTGSGAVTPSERQLEYAKAWGVNGWFARGEYLARLVEVAQQTGFDLRSLGTKHIHSFLGPDLEGHLRRQLEEAWGAPVYDNYGSHEIGLVAFECAAQDRKHISEDTVFVEFADVDTGAPLPWGARGNLVATSLHRSVPPLIRFNMRDCLVGSEREVCACGLATRKLSTFLGRSDEMVKLRGTNVYPLACQNAVVRDQRTTGEFLCVVRHVGEGLGRREEMTVRVERRSREIDPAALTQDLRQALHRELGVRVDVEVVDADVLAEFTGLGRQNKVRRLLDLRNKER
jgi:phenylacetate-CoA ligase